MNLQKLYSEIYEKNRAKILHGGEYVDPTIDDPADTRMGLVALIRPSDEIKENISRIIDKLREIEPEQYYYPTQDLHITLLDIIKAKPDFHYTKEQKENAIALCHDAFYGIGPFSIEMTGLVMSDDCIMVKGFYEDKMTEIRERLRKKTTDHGLVSDERYPTKSSHITISRFRKPLSDREKFVRAIDEHGEHMFGEFEVTEIELVYHNWFDSKKELIETFSL